MKWLAVLAVVALMPLSVRHAAALSCDNIGLVGQFHRSHHAFVATVTSAVFRGPRSSDGERNRERRVHASLEVLESYKAPVTFNALQTNLKWSSHEAFFDVGKTYYFVTDESGQFHDCNPPREVSGARLTEFLARARRYSRDSTSELTAPWQANVSDESCDAGVEIYFPRPGRGGSVAFTLPTKPLGKRAASARVYVPYAYDYIEIHAGRFETRIELAKPANHWISLKPADAMPFVRALTDGGPLILSGRMLDGGDYALTVNDHGLTEALRACNVDAYAPASLTEPKRTPNLSP